MKAKKKFPAKCRSVRCRGVVLLKSCHSPYCARCRMRRWKDKHPLKAAFHSLRGHAKERGKDFSLTFEQFHTFCLNTDYMKMRGRTTLSLHIDRKNNDEGYHAGNVQAITLIENNRKQFVPYFANQQENINYEPTAEEIEEIQRQLAEV